jgi:urocanate hydratase
MELVYRLYFGLARDMDPDVALGGKLVYAGELDAEGCRLVRAANVAGAASLSATADAATQRLAIRDGVIDFLVTSLEEALRILKNEIRKHNAVAVGVGLAPVRVAAEMRERGVLPDLLRPSAPAEEVADFVAQGALFVAPAAIPAGHEFCAIADAPPDFEARALEMIPEGDTVARRWLRLSPRYLGPQMRRVRSLACDVQIAALLKN